MSTGKGFFRFPKEAFPRFGCAEDFGSVSGGRGSGCQPGACRPKRQRGRSSVLHRRKGDEEGKLTFLQRDVRQFAGELFFFRGQFLYLRQFAGGLFFFRLRKKNQESFSLYADCCFSCCFSFGYSSFVAERRTKKGATLSNGWTTTWGPYPQDPRRR